MRRVEKLALVCLSVFVLVSLLIFPLSIKKEENISNEDVHAGSAGVENNKTLTKRFSYDSETKNRWCAVLLNVTERTTLNINYSTYYIDNNEQKYSFESLYLLSGKNLELAIVARSVRWGNTVGEVHIQYDVGPFNNSYDRDGYTFPGGGKSELNIEVKLMPGIWYVVMVSVPHFEINLVVDSPVEIASTSGTGVFIYNSQDFAGTMNVARSSSSTVYNCSLEMEIKNSVLCWSFEPVAGLRDATATPRKSTFAVSYDGPQGGGSRLYRINNGVYTVIDRSGEWLSPFTREAEGKWVWTIDEERSSDSTMLLYGAPMELPETH